MFGTKNSEETTNQKGSTFISNRINKGTSVTGEIDSDGDLRIEGVVKGLLRTRAKVAVGPTGLIEGDVYCKNADIEGKIIGDIEVTDLLTLKATCLVEGNIYTGKIMIENGAQFNGICTMGTKEKHQNVEKTLAAALRQEAEV